MQPAWMCLYYLVCFPVLLMLKLSRSIWKVSHFFTVWSQAENVMNKLQSAISAEFVLQVVHLSSYNRELIVSASIT